MKKFPRCQGHDPENPLTPNERACKAQELLHLQPGPHHPEPYGPYTQSVQDGIIHLLGDLRHLCDRLDLDYAALDRRGYEFYRNEKSYALFNSFSECAGLSIKPRRKP